MTLIQKFAGPLPRRIFLLFFLAPLLFSAAGCNDDAPSAPTSIRYDGHPVLPGQLQTPLPQELRFSIYGDPISGLIGLKPNPIAGAEVVFDILDQPDGAKAVFDPPETKSDAGGLVRTVFTVGDKPGVYRIAARLKNYPNVRPVNLVVIGGVIIQGANQDGWIGENLDHNLVVRLESAPNVFLGAGKGRVRFDLRNNPGGVTLSRQEGVTSGRGEASTSVHLGMQQGQGEIGITILAGIPGADHVNYYLPVHFFAIDGKSMIIAILGGVALFLFGMRMMSEGLQHVAGDKLRGLLNILTNNRFLAAAAGAGVTALIQSSSTCTVMVVGFVNAGLMRLEQTIGVIMGANIGTTITAQIISLKLSSLALPAITLGVIITIVARRQSTRYWASVIIGFGILFLGMNIMSEKLSELKSSSSMIALFKGLNCLPGPSGYVPVLQFAKAIGIGIISTLILQSSSATIGVLMVIAGAGLIDPYAAFGILLGDNIGTTITAVLAAIGSTTAAKRAACFHVMFNVIGVSIMIILNFVSWPGHVGRPIFLDLVNEFTPGDVFAGENLTRFLANAHTLFNISCTLMFIPFVTPFAALCRLIIKSKPGEDDKEAASRFILEPHLLSTPSLAIQQVWAEVGVMLAKGREAQADGFKALIGTDTPDWDEVAKSARKLEQETDELQAAVTNYLGSIPLTGLNENQSEMFPRMIRTVNDAERIGDLGRHLSKLGKRVRKRSLPFTPEAVADMESMTAIVDQILQLSEKAVAVNADGIETTGGGAVLRRKFLDEGKKLDKAAKAKASELRKSHECRHEAGMCDIRSGVIYMDVVNSLARSAGHALNVIEAACHSVRKRK